MGVVSLAVRQGCEDHNCLEALLDRVTVRSVDDILDAAQFLRDFSHQNGLRVALCADVADESPMADAEGHIIADTVFGWNEIGDRWWAQRHLALQSPLANACRYESEPFWINSAGFHGSVPNPYLQIIDLKEFFSHFAVSQSAIVVPVHLPFAQVSANSFHPIEREVDDLSGTFAMVGGVLSILTRRFVAGYVQATRSKRRIPSDCALSKREVACLRWAAIGKTDREIAMIIGLSHATIRYHIQRAGQKLDSINRAQTIFKAGQLGFLGANS